MVADPQLEHRVSRLENDRDAIYELITEIKTTQQEHTERFDRMDGRFDRMDGRFDRMDGRFDRMDERFDGVEATLTEVVRRLPDRS